MKKLLLICLLAGGGHSFAQNLALKDLQQILEAPTTEQVNQLLAPKGFSLPKETTNAIWGFKSDVRPDASYVAQLYRITDTAGIKLIYETANPFFYSNLLNQLPVNNFQFKQTTTTDHTVNLVFSNGRQELLLDFVYDEHADKPYRITLQTANPLRTLLAPKYDLKTRVNSY